MITFFSLLLGLAIQGQAPIDQQPQGLLDQPAVQPVAQAQGPVKDFGWAGPQAVARAQRELGDRIPPTYRSTVPYRNVRGTATGLWIWIQRENDDEHLAAFRQLIGDCTAFGATKAITTSLAVELGIGDGEGDLIVPYPPHLYGGSRVVVGGGQIAGDGSTGIWTAEFCTQSGIIPSSDPRCPPYSATVAREWGRRGPPRWAMELAANYRCEARKIETWEEAIQANAGGSAIAICSGQGFRDQAVERNGRVEGIPEGRWNHCLAMTGYDDRPGREAGYIENSWGPDAHASIEMYRRLGDTPPGGFWVPKAIIVKMLAADDSYAYSFRGFADHARLSRQAKPRPLPNPLVPVKQFGWVDPASLALSL